MNNDSILSGINIGAVGGKKRERKRKEGRKKKGKREEEGRRKEISK